MPEGRRRPGPGSTGGPTGGSDGYLVVLESFPAPHERTTPYHLLLFDSFPDRIDARYFTWRRALLEDFDVLHLHWPEVKVRGTTWFRSTVRTVLFLVLLFRIRCTRRALVRTLHDRTPHERPNAVQRAVIWLSERWTTSWIVLNGEDRPPTSAPWVRSRIGPYDTWFPQEAVEAVPGRLVHFGMVRRYKGITDLLRAFGEVEDASVTLRIVGSADDGDLATELREATERDPRITFRDEFVSDEDLALEVGRGELVVLPFSRITNSSSVLVALSLGRPVLAPDLPLIAEVSEEVGPGWVLRYSGQLSGEDLTGALERVRADSDRPAPDLSSRSWSTIGEDHAAAFEEAIRLVRR